MTTDRLDPATTLGFAHLTVADLDRAVAFYTETLGFTERERVGETARLTAGPAGDWLRLTALAGAQRKPRHATGLYHIAILTPDRPALARSLRRLAERRYPLQGASDHLVSEALYLADPDGNGLEIYRDRPRAEWPRREGQIQMDTLPLDLDQLLAEGRADPRPWDGLEPATRLGHAHLHVAHLDEAVRFYRDVVGFDLMIQLAGSAAFLAAGGYHHHLGLNTWAGVGAPPPPPNAVGIRAFEVLLTSPAERDRLLERYRAAGVTWEETSEGILARDPSGNALVARVAA